MKHNEDEFRWKFRSVLLLMAKALIFRVFDHLPGLFGSFNILEKLQIPGRDGTFIHQYVEMNGPLPEALSE
jgi:hypothetical protein